MAKRTNTAIWSEKHKRWQINVQKDGTRRSLYNGTPGRTEQREALAKADAWLDEGIDPAGKRMEEIYPKFLEKVKQTTSQSMHMPMVSGFRVWVKPAIGKTKIASLTEQKLQDRIDAAHAAGRSRKTLMNIRGDLTAFLKFCRKSK